MCSTSSRSGVRAAACVSSSLHPITQCVLHTVKWLGDVYAMPIEAIQCQLFEDASGVHSLTFERLLPLKSDDAFDLTVKAAEGKRAGVSAAPETGDLEDPPPRDRLDR